MKIKLKSNLEHQNNAIKAIVSVFNNVLINSSNNIYQNPIIDLNDDDIINNIKLIQSGGCEGIEPIYDRYRNTINNKEMLNLDIRMETGTGKTYVYTKMMFELNKLYKFKKFIIIVPSTPIREGTRQFILSDYVKKHFSDDYNNKVLQLDVLCAQNTKKNGRKMMPAAITNFVSGTKLNGNRINALLMSDSMLLSKATMEKNDYDQTLLGHYTQPYQAIESTRPIVIIDEPHRFKRDNKAYKCIIEKLKPQLLIRFGATFPDKVDGVKDYENLIYNLDSKVAFNKQLVKGIEVEYLPNINEKDTKIKLIDINNTNPKSVTFRNESNKKKYSMNIGTSMANINKNFSNIFVEEIGKCDDIPNSVRLSNGTIVKMNDIIYPNIYGKTYQELMLSLALDRHFEKEKENFLRKIKIKTVALFFIDNRYSYRGEENNGELKVLFERLLKNKVKEIIHNIDNDTDNKDELKEYREYLEATLNNISKTNGGYFSNDNFVNDEDIKIEIDNILRDKEKLLSIKDKNGQYNVFRFVFSQWTLREGWDNPNVFTIAKLRSSGSEISKLQEVGRGLRLPVDINGNRVSDEQFYLNYIVDYSEKNFAVKVLNEINVDCIKNKNIKSEIELYCNKNNIEFKDMFVKLYLGNLIDNEYNIIPDNLEILYSKYPDLISGIYNDKIIDKNKKENSRVGIRKDNFNELKDLWTAINQKFYLAFEELDEVSLIEVIVSILDKNINSEMEITTIRTKTICENNEIKLKSTESKVYETNELIPYNEFLMRIERSTSIPITVFNKAVIKYNNKNKIGNDFFNVNSLKIFISEFLEWKKLNFIHRFTFKKLDVDVRETALTYRGGKVRDYIQQADVGIKCYYDKETPQKFLYDKFVYDSELEKENIEKSGIDEVIVFGKIPRRSIKIPLFWGGTYSPDFMYLIKKNDESIQLNFIVETKDVKSESTLRKEETDRIECAKVFFKKLNQIEGLKVRFDKQLKKDNIVVMIRKILNSK